jgi:hypothetical protein
MHVAAAFAGRAQSVVHVPQCIVSDVRSAQVVSQRVCPGAHMMLHVPLSQTGALAGQTVPQVPQFAGSFADVEQSGAVAGHRSQPVLH